MPQIALSSHLVETLRNLPDRPRQQVLDALEKIHHGQFDGGLRVKKLQSRPSVAVWEARVNQAARLLFTYGRHTDRHTREPVLTVHCWTVVFDHDDVPRVLRRKAFDVPDAMQWIVAEEIDACEWAQPQPENPAADLDAIERDFPGTNRWDAYAALSSEYQATLSAPPENLPWYLESPVAFAEWAEAEEVPAELILSDEQVRLLQESLPTFLNGPAGSGKTTLALYRLLVIQENDPEADIAFVTHNPRLVAHARDLYDALPMRPEDAAPVDFKTYRELAAETMGMGVADLQHYQVPPERLRRFLGRHPLSSAEQQLYATDIRAVVKGMLPLQKTPALDSDVCNLLPRTVYCNEMPSTWSAVPRRKRNAVYRLAQQYQEALRGDNRMDDQDIATRALRRLLGGSKPRRYDALVLDEVQDLTEKQLRVALATLREGARTQMLLAGDPTQVLGGSGFGWRMPRAIFHERGWDPPKPYTLTRSYRASAPTLRLPEALADLLKQEEADVVSLNPDQARATGPPPVRTLPNDAVEATLSEAHPGVLILTESEDEAARLRDAWGHPLVWTVADAKGLEADHVVLYQLPDRLIDRPGAAPAEREAARQKNRQTLRMHYVAATRARKSVSVVADPHPAGSVWTHDAVQRTVNPMAQFRAPWAGNPSQEEWESRAGYYRDREHWAPAAECYRKAGQEAWAVLCEWLDAVLTARASGESVTPPTEAPAPWHNADALTEAQAALLLDYGIGQSDTPLRIRLLRQAGRPEEAEALAAEHAARTGRWREAAEYYRAHDRLAEAARLYYQGEAWADAAPCYRACGRWARAAQCYRRTEAWLDAAACYRENRDWEEAAACYARADAWTDAATCHRTIGAWTDAASCYQEAGDHRAAAECYRRVDAWTQAASCYAEAGAAAWAATCRVLAEHATANAALTALREAYDPLPAPIAAFLVKRELYNEADEALLAAWLLRCAERDPDAVLPTPVIQTNGTDYALTYNGGGWYEIATWEGGVHHEKVQGTARLPDALHALAEPARTQHETAQEAPSSSLLF